MKYKVLKVDETHGCSGIPEGVEKVYGVYLFNPREGVQACEITPSYEAVYVTTQAITAEQELSEEQWNAIAEYEAECTIDADNHISYFHMNSIDDLDGLPTFTAVIDYDDEPSWWEVWEQVIEQYRANPVGL